MMREGSWTKKWIGRWSYYFAISLAISIPASGFGSAKNEIPSRLLVRVADQADLSAALRKIPKAFRLLVRFKNQLILRKDPVVSDEDVALIRKISGVVHVERDEGMNSAEFVAMPRCESDTYPSREAEALVNGLTRVAPQNCGLFPACEVSKKTLNWSQTAIDSDLMINRMSLRNYVGDSRSLPAVKVAVLDSGFDDAQRTKMRKGQPRVIAGLGWSETDAPSAGARLELDEGGHGTSVAGLISAKDGIGMNPDADLTVVKLRYLSGETNFQFSKSEVKLSADRACSEGNEIINLSIVATTDVKGKLRWEDEDREFFRSLAERGCLIVVSAGNQGYTTEYGSDDPDDSLLRVAATDPSGTRSSFSNHGEITAPGSGVRTLTSSTQSPLYQNPMAIPENPKWSCHTAGEALEDGTSFSGPIVAGIASNVLQILKESAAYNSLSPKDRVRALNRILQASAQKEAGGVNGLRAVEIAIRFGKNKKNVPTVNELRALLQSIPPAVCGETLPRCSELPCKDDQKKDCTMKAREKSALCSSISPAESADLVKLALDEESFELAAHYLERGKGREGFTDALRKISSELPWRQFTGGKFRDFSPVIDAYAIFLDAGGPRDPKTVTALRNRMDDSDWLMRYPKEMDDLVDERMIKTGIVDQKLITKILKNRKMKKSYDDDFLVDHLARLGSLKTEAAKVEAVELLKTALKRSTHESMPGFLANEILLSSPYTIWNRDLVEVLLKSGKFGESAVYGTFASTWPDTPESVADQRWLLGKVYELPEHTRTAWEKYLVKWRDRLDGKVTD